MDKHWLASVVAGLLAALFTALLVWALVRLYQAVMANAELIAAELARPVQRADLVLLFVLANSCHDISDHAMRDRVEDLQHSLSRIEMELRYDEGGPK